METVARVLIEHGPLTRDEVVARLGANGVADPEAVAKAALDQMGCPAAELVDGRWIWIPALVQGRVLTHAVDAFEVEHDLLTPTPDLRAIAELFDHSGYERLVDGSPVRVIVADFEDELLVERGIPLDTAPEVGLLLPAGTLRRLQAAAGDLIGVRLSDEGLTVERVDSAAPADDIGERLAALLAPDRPTFVDSAVYSLCLDDPEVFTTPLPPLSSIIADQGLVLDGESVAPAGFDFEQWRRMRHAELRAQQYGISPEEALAVGILVTIYQHDTHAEHPDSPALIAEVAAVLSDPVLAEFFLIEAMSTVDSPAMLRSFAETVEPLAPRSARVAYRWLRAMALEQSGDVEAAEREYLSAESMDTEFLPALLDLARFASDRGDAERGLALLRRAGVGADHPLLDVLERHRATPRSDIGRNDPCWCGSGRKYKKCHLGREELSLEDRAQWLYFKACQHVLSLPTGRELFEEVADERMRYASTQEEADEFADDPLNMDVALFEGGEFEDFLDQRGHLLPADERLLAEQWLLAERSVFDVQEVQRGRSLVVRDVRTGDVREVRERAASGVLRPGDLICARVVPVGERFEIFGGLEPVALHARDALIDMLDSEPEAADLVAFLTARFAPPTLVNTEGEPTVFCESQIRVGPDVEGWLDDTYERVGAKPEWAELVVTDGQRRLRASLELDGDVLSIHTNSEQRMDRVVKALTAVDPSATILSDERTPLDDVADIAAHAPPGAVNLDDPALIAARDVFVRDYEEKWLDEAIPALDGWTPREAADDPTRRGDLIRLLDGFPASEGGMSADRLRAALGL